jgi:hypothetical protein
MFPKPLIPLVPLIPKLVANATTHLSWPSSKATCKVGVMVNISVLGLWVSYLTETSTTSDTLVTTWYRTTPLSSGGRSLVGFHHAFTNRLQ